MRSTNIGQLSGMLFVASLDRHSLRAHLQPCPGVFLGGIALSARPVRAGRHVRQARGGLIFTLRPRYVSRVKYRSTCICIPRSARFVHRCLAEIQTTYLDPCGPASVDHALCIYTIHREFLQSSSQNHRVYVKWGSNNVHGSLVYRIAAIMLLPCGPGLQVHT